MNNIPVKEAMAEARKELSTVLVKLRELQKLEQRKATLENFIASCNDVLNYNLQDVTVEVDGVTGLRPVSAAERGLIKDDRLWEAAQLVMGIANRPLTASEMLAALLTNGFEIRGEHKRENIRSVMTRKDDVFVKVGRGMFALKEWSDELKHSRIQDDLSDEQPNESALAATI